MNSRAVNRSLVVSVGLSALVHALVIVPLLMAMFASGGPSPRMEAFFSSEPLKPDDQDERQTEREPALGIEKSTASTLTWVGYDEYVEHLAQLSEVEQAAFTDAPTGKDAMPEEMRQPVEEVVEAEPAPTHEPSEAIEVVKQPVEERVEEVVAAEIESLEPPPSFELPSRLPEIDLARIARVLDGLIGLMSRELDEVEAEEIVDVEPVKHEEAEELQEGAVPETSGSESSAPDPESPGEPAESADKQSDATSIIEITQANWRLGRPLAARGVELKPQRPQFSIMQRLASSPCNPLVEIHFSQAGAAATVTIAESSRDPSIDAAIEASAYRWRAEGEAIGRLKEEQTFAVRIRFILNPYARCP